MFNLTQSKYIAIPFISVILSACGGGGGGSDDGGTSPPQDDPPPLEEQTGVFVDSPVAGVDYATETRSGTTNNLGEYFYLAGETVVFSIGNIDFPPVVADGIVSPLDMVENGTIDTPLVILIARLLQSLDSDGNPDNGITITEEVIDAAETITFDEIFADEDTFEEVAAAFVDEATGGEAILVTEEEAIEHLEDSLEEVGELDPQPDPEPDPDPQPDPEPDPQPDPTPDPQDYNISVIVTDLSITDGAFNSIDLLDLLNNENGDFLTFTGNNDLVTTGNATAELAEEVFDGDIYDVEILNGPNDHDCAMVGGTGTVNGSNPTITIDCIMEWVGTYSYNMGYDETQISEILNVPGPGFNSLTALGYSFTAAGIKNQIVSFFERGLNQGDTLSELTGPGDNGRNNAGIVMDIPFDADDPNSANTIWAVGACLHTTAGDFVDSMVITSYDQGNGQVGEHFHFSQSDEDDASAYGIAAFSDNSVVVAGHTRSDTFENMQASGDSLGTTDVVIMRLNPDEVGEVGNGIIWKKRITEQYNERHYGGLVVEANEDVLFNYEYAIAGQTRVVVQRLEGINGNEKDSAQFAADGGADMEVYEDGLAQDSQGNTYVLTTIYNTRDDGNDGMSENQFHMGFGDYFLIKLNADLETVWSRYYGSAEEEVSSGGIIIDENDNIYIAGYTLESTPEFPGNDDKVYVVKLDTDGNIQWESKFNNTIGGDNDMDPTAISLDRIGNPIIAGQTGGQFTGFEANGWFAFVLKLNQENGEVWEERF